MADGGTIDVLFGDYIEQTYRIHVYILTAKPVLFENAAIDGPVEDPEAFFGREGFGPKTCQKILYIFGLGEALA